MIVLITYLIEFIVIYEFTQSIINAERHFWECVEKDIPPYVYETAAKTELS
ncbi:hypothetical protein [Acinetobacter guillouiae]|uniref:hypothetical protein n=1 Tax=Acinetobacter guillouiae TaxID=106649 RepID=UPI002FD883C4